MKVLRRFIALSGGEKASIVVLTAASTLNDEMWRLYDNAFAALGVLNRTPIDVETREDANDPVRAAAIENAGGVFMTGGDQRRLLALIGGTGMASAMHRAYRIHGACIAGTSAGASAMSEHMLAESRQNETPQKGTTHLAAGLGFLPRVVIDQHFSARRRLGRLLSVIAQNPYLLGIGIDEDTALVVERGKSFEVVGQGAVTLIDGRTMSSNFLDADESERLELINVKLHYLPSGARFPRPGKHKPQIAHHSEFSATVHDLISRITDKEIGS